MITMFLIALSIIVSLIVWRDERLYCYGMNRDSLARGAYRSFLAQVLMFQFIHGNLLHLVLNSYFLYSAGTILEDMFGIVQYIVFFLTTTIVSVIGLLLFVSKSNTIGISGYCMAILAYLWMTLTMMGDPGAGSIGNLLIINIALGFLPGISFVGHAVGAAWGLVFWGITTYLFSL